MSFRMLLVPLFIVLSITASVAPFSRAANDVRVTMFRSDAARTGQMPGPGPVKEIAERWRFATSGPISSSAVISNGIIFFGSEDGSLYALDERTGKLQWVFETSAPVRSTPAISAGRVYFGSDDGSIYAVSASTGKQTWRFETGAAVSSSPAVGRGVVYVGSEDGNLYALAEADGSELWRFESSKPIVSSPALVDGTIYVGGDALTLYALDAATGSEKWRFEAGGAFRSTPAVTPASIFVGNNDRFLYAVDPEYGTELWRFETRSGVRSSAAVSGEMIFVGSYDGNVYGIDRGNGEERWRFSTASGIGSSPSVWQDTVYIGSGDGFVLAIDADTGEQVWSFKTGSYVTASPMVANGVVFVGSHDGNFYALGDPIPPTPAPTPKPELASGAIAEVSIDKAALRGAPSDGAVVRAELSLGQELKVRGEPEEQGNKVWWPVTVLETGIKGWIDENSIRPIVAAPSPTEKPSSRPTATRVAPTPTPIVDLPSLEILDTNTVSAGLGDGSLYGYVDIRNNTDELFSFVQVNAVCRNEQGTVVATGFGNTLNLAPGESTTVTVIILNAEGCVRVTYEIDDISYLLG